MTRTLYTNHSTPSYLLPMESWLRKHGVFAAGCSIALALLAYGLDRDPYQPPAVESEPVLKDARRTDLTRRAAGLWGEIGSCRTGRAIGLAPDSVRAAMAAADIRLLEIAREIGTHQMFNELTHFIPTPPTAPCDWRFVVEVIRRVDDIGLEAKRLP